MKMPQVIGYRGNKTVHDEITLQGFNSIFNPPKLDVVVSKDKQLFVSHDLYTKFK